MNERMVMEAKAIKKKKNRIMRSFLRLVCPESLVVIDTVSAETIGRVVEPDRCKRSAT